jgi:hypothetical protein
MNSSTPPASAISQSPLRSACDARWIATIEVEHALRQVKDGPRSPSR